MNYLSLISLLLQNSGLIKNLFKKSETNSNALERITEVAPQAIDLLKSIGSQLFPQATPEIQVVGTLAAFDAKYVTWLQQSLNTLINSNLQTDGIYGHLTTEAVKAYQTANNLLIDGVAGKITEQSIKDKLNV